MSLSSTDLLEIRNIFKEELVKELAPIKGELEALSNDIKEIYNMITEMQKSRVPTEQFDKLSIEQKLLKLNSELLFAAKEAGVSLPR